MTTTTRPKSVLLRSTLAVALLIAGVGTMLFSHPQTARAGDFGELPIIDPPHLNLQPDLTIDRSVTPRHSDGWYIVPIENQGFGDAGSFVVRIYVYEDLVMSSHWTTLKSGLPAGHSFSFAFEPNDKGARIDAYVVIDMYDGVDEANETNNYGWISWLD